MEKIIKAIRESFDEAEEVYTEGACFQFYLILKSICPYAEPWYDCHVGHVYTKVGDKYYDVKGQLKDDTILKRVVNLLEEDWHHIYKEAPDWRFEDFKRTKQKLSKLEQAKQ